MSKQQEIESYVWQEDPSIVVASVELSLVFYLAVPIAWARGAAAGALDAFLRHAPSGDLRWWRTTRQDTWNSFRAGDAEAHRAQLSSSMLPRPRHLFGFDVVDAADVPSLGFSYREVDPARGAQASTLAITLPQESNPQTLLAIAREICDLGPLWCGVGGFGALWNPFFRELAGHATLSWCRRYLGLDHQDPEMARWLAPSGLLGVNWLTVVGSEIGKALSADLSSLTSAEWPEGVRTYACRHGVLVRAGAVPTTGDSNRVTYPRDYAAVARRLAPWFNKEDPRPWVLFDDDPFARGWFRRFLEPAKWD